MLKYFSVTPPENSVGAENSTENSGPHAKNFFCSVYESSLRHPVWVPEINVNPCNSVYVLKRRFKVGIYCSLRLLNFYKIYIHLYRYHTDMGGPVLSKLFVRYNTPVPWNASSARAKILYRCIASKNRFLNRLYRFIARKLDQLYRFIAGKIILSRILYRFIGDKNFGQKIVSLYSIIFSKIVYLYRFKRYIFEYRCPPLLIYG